MPEQPTLSKDELAALLNVKPSTLARNRTKLEAGGMPRPLPGAGLIWSRKNILAWIDGELAIKHPTRRAR